MQNVSAIASLQNHLLASLNTRTRDHLLPYLQLCQLPSGKVLYEPNMDIPHIYFPTNAIVSLLYVTEQGNSSELAVIGNDGVVGISQFMSGHNFQSRAVVQCAGNAYRLSAHHAMEEFDLYGDLMQCIMVYIQELMAHIGQTAVCNRHHKMEQRLSRWLLHLLDRLPSNTLAITHEQIAGILGVRREGVTDAASKLRSLGVIDNSRGHIRVLDRNALECLSCECYGVVKSNSDRLHTLQSRNEPAASIFSSDRAHNRHDKSHVIHRAP